MNLQFSRAHASDAGFLGSLAMRSKAYWGYSSSFMTACRAELCPPPGKLEDPAFIYVKATKGDGCVGFYALERISETQYELEALFVEPHWIGQGVGRALMDHAKSHVRKLGGNHLVIQGDPNAQSFYEAAGGVCAGTRESVSIPGRLLPIFHIHL